MKTDLEIQKDVQAELSWEPAINSAEIGVSVKDGIVTLSGTLNSYYKKTMAENATRRVEGVRGIAENIEIRSGHGFIKNDTELASDVLTALHMQSLVDPSAIKVKVENGLVTLYGEVHWRYQRNMLASLIGNIAGVKNINNEITIHSAVVPKDLRYRINSAFHRHASLDAKNVQFEIDNDIVTLTGSVSSLLEKTEAENAVWSSPGVTRIINKLTVRPEVPA